MVGLEAAGKLLLTSRCNSASPSLTHGSGCLRLQKRQQVRYGREAGRSTFVRQGQEEDASTRCSDCRGYVENALSGEDSSFDA